MSEQKNKKTQVGIVVSDKMDSTIVVLTERLYKHKLYGKFLRRNEKYMADDPQEVAGMGDRVLIEECRPISKNKRWRVREVIQKAV
ncbi:MAG: 30S ribosomal protein S17 [Desulfurivibrionaceae bacterium]|nr:30S ribosomal protein S17 [Desulfurivibrionaceae bacterium]